MDEKIVQHVAKIARLNLSNTEVSQMTKDLDSIIKYFEIIDKIKEDSTEPAHHPVKLSPKTREDVPKKSFSPEEALAHTNHKEKGYFKGPGVL